MAMGNADAVPTPEQLDLLARVIRQVSKASRLRAQDEEDFTQSVHVKLLERRYDIFQRFQGRSSLRTYLTVVVRRLLLDWRISLYGKWRPSATAMRLGEHAIRLEQLINRDRLTVAEAVEVVRGSVEGLSAAELFDLASQLPNRVRPHEVSDHCITEAHGVPFDDPVEASQRHQHQVKTWRALVTAVRRLPAEDRQLVSLRYWHGRSLQSIARLLDQEPKSLYRRYERVLKRLRRIVTDDYRLGAPIALRAAGDGRLEE
jgi:RNA polymerase sigma factor (sigma-70 family)